MRARVVALIVSALLSSACRDRRDSDAAASDAAAAPAVSSWPELPRSEDAARRLVRAKTTRVNGAREAGGAPSIAEVALRARSEGLAKQLAGDARIAAWLSARIERAGARDAYLLFGTMHDSAGQLDAFRRLVAPGGVRGLALVAIEQLTADGHWGGAPADAQRGHDALLAAYEKRGDAASFDALARAHAQHDYASYKFGYAREVMDLVAIARASRTRLVGCDMPSALQDLVTKERGGDGLHRLRELHCVLAMNRARGKGPMRAALFWGKDHVAATSLRRFLPPDAVVVALFAFGRRAEPDAPDAELARSFVLDDPLLVPINDEEAALLLPDDATRGRVDRVRASIDSKLASPVVRVRALAAGRFAIDDRSFDLVANEQRALDVDPGDHTYAFEPANGGPAVVGAIDVPPRGAAEIEIDVEHRRTRRVVLE